MAAGVYVIAEAGVNHNGSLELATELVRAAKSSGADAVKFQAFSADALVTPTAGKADYQARATGADESQLEMLRRLELDEDAHRILQRVCAEEGIDFLSSAFDLASVSMLGRLGLSQHKIPSGEINNLPYLREVAALGTPVILSTGTADMSEIADALSALVAAGTPLRSITVLHCSTEYPAPLETVNLLAMVSIREEFGVAVGYSDHTEGIAIPVAAVALGARVIEKHLTLDRGLPGPDHAASLEPGQFGEMVSAIRNVETAMGDGVKRPSQTEMANRDVVRKSIVAARRIAAGELFSSENLTTKRPGTGMSPMQWDEVLGMVASRAFEADEEVAL